MTLQCPTCVEGTVWLFIGLILALGIISVVWIVEQITRRKK